MVSQPGSQGGLCSPFCAQGGRTSRRQAAPACGLLSPDTGARERRRAAGRQRPTRAPQASPATTHVCPFPTSSPTAALPCARTLDPSVTWQLLATGEGPPRGTRRGRVCRHCLRGSPLFCGLRGNCVLCLCFEMEDEFARFQAELGALEQADTPGEEQQQKQPVEAPTPHVVAPPVSAAQVSRPAVIARPAAPASVQAAAQLPGRRDHYGVRPLRPSLFTTHALTLTHATPHFQGPPTGAALPPPPAAFAPLPPAPVLPFAYRAPPLHPPPASHAAQQHGQQEKVVHVRSAAGEKWVDPSMADWPDSAFIVVVFCLPGTRSVCTDTRPTALQTTTAFLLGTWGRR